MKKELVLTLAAIVATLPLLAANAAEILNFGPNLPTGTLPNGYAGFDWHGAQNDVFADTTPSFFGSLFITEFKTYAFGGGTLLTLNMDDVNAVKFNTTNIRTVFGQPVIISTPDLTLVSQLTVDKSVTRAPEIDPTTAASALSLLIGGLLIVRGRRNPQIGRI